MDSCFLLLNLLEFEIITTDKLNIKKVNQYFNYQLQQFSKEVDRVIQANTAAVLKLVISTAI